MLDLNKAVILNDEVLTNDIHYDKNGSLLVIRFYKGSCLVDVINNIKSKEQADKIIAEYKEFNYIFLPIDEETSININNKWDYVRKNKNDIPSFIDEFGIHPREIMACGDTKATNGFAKHYISECKIVDRGDVFSLADKEKAIKAGKFISSYKCFATNNYKFDINKKENAGLIHHEDVLSSWNCLMASLHHPSHGIIIRKYK